MELMIRSGQESFHGLRQSHRFILNQTKGNININARPSEAKKFRRSLKFKHKDLKLDAHTRHVRDVQKMLKNESQVMSIK